jgi:hypothetical protein
MTSRHQPRGLSAPVPLDALDPRGWAVTAIERRVDRTQRAAQSEPLRARQRCHGVCVGLDLDDGREADAVEMRLKLSC